MHTNVTTEIDSGFQPSMLFLHGAMLHLPQCSEASGMTHTSFKTSGLVRVRYSSRDRKAQRFGCEVTHFFAFPDFVGLHSLVPALTLFRRHVRYQSVGIWSRRFLWLCLALTPFF